MECLSNWSNLLAWIICPEIENWGEENCSLINGAPHEMFSIFPHYELDQVLFPSVSHWSNGEPNKVWSLNSGICYIFGVFALWLGSDLTWTLIFPEPSQVETIEIFSMVLNTTESHGIECHWIAWYSQKTFQSKFTENISIKIDKNYWANLIFLFGWNEKKTQPVTAME